MKKLFLLFTLLASAVSAQPFNQPAPASAATAPIGTSLLSGNATVASGILTITLKTKGGEFNAWSHVFIDLGPAAKPSYAHTSGVPAGTSLELLFEGSQVYRFSGESSSVWAWTPLAGVVVERAVVGDTMTLKTPLANLGLPSGGTVKLFAASYTPDYTESLDTLPRDTRSWTFNVPKYSAPLPGKKTSANDSPSSTPTNGAEDETSASKVAASAPTVAPLPPRNDARAAFQRIKSYMCYYGPGRTDDLLTRDALIIETKNQTTAEVNALRAAGKLTVGYISIGEDSELRQGDRKGPGGYDSAYFDRNKDNVPDKNETWNSYFANAGSPSWRAHFLARSDEILKTHGVDGFFLDTIETSLAYPASIKSMVSLIRDLRARHPNAIIVMNRGWDLLPDLGNTPDGIMFESFTLSYDFTEKRYVSLRASGVDYGLDVWKKFIRPAQQRHALVALALDYAASPDSPEVASAYDRAVTLGMIPCVANINLDAFYNVSYQGKVDKRWLAPTETSETRIVTLNTSRNGFPAGTRVVPSSNYSDYTVAAVVDGVTEKDTLGWRDRAWASVEDTGEHFLEFSLPAPTRASGVSVDWAQDNGTSFPARSFRIEVRPAGASASNSWTRVARIEDNTGSQSRLTFEPADITALRIVQAPKGGASLRPNLMWVQQVSLIP